MGLGKKERKGYVLGSTKDGKQIDARSSSTKNQEKSQLYEYFDITCAEENLGKLGLMIPYDNMVVKSVECQEPSRSTR